MKARRLHSWARARQQRGVVLFVALIVLVVMTLAGLALLRQMGVGTSIAGNLAFKENATSVADRGTEFARRWLIDNAPLTANDDFSKGYHSSWSGNIDPTSYAWDTESLTVTAPEDVAQTGNTTQIIIHRLCATANMSALDPAQRCSDEMVSSPSKGGGSYGATSTSTSPAPFFRITARVEGPRRTMSYTQVLLSPRDD